MLPPLPSTINLRNLSGSLAFLLLALLSAGALAFGVFRYSEQAVRALEQAQAAQAESRARLTYVQDDEQQIRTKIDRYRTLLANGITRPERRLDWVETMRNIKEKRRLFVMEYEITPQQPLDPQNVATGGYSFLVSAMKLDMLLLHENDLLGLLAELKSQVPALVSVRRCTLERLPAPEQGAQLRAQCEIDWITLQEKLI